MLPTDTCIPCQNLTLPDVWYATATSVEDLKANAAPLGYDDRLIDHYISEEVYTAVDDGGTQKVLSVELCTYCTDVGLQGCTQARCAVGYHSYKSVNSYAYGLAACELCNTVPNAGENATYTCTNLLDSRVSECLPGHFKTNSTNSSVADTCTPWRVCGAGTDQVNGTVWTDASCHCKPGFFEPTSAGVVCPDGVCPDCTPWTPCGEGVQVSTNGSSFADQECGVVVAVETKIDGAMDTAAFMLAIVSAMASDEGSSINASAVSVSIDVFEQKIESAATVPGSVDDYANPNDPASPGYARALQFRTGVANTLAVELEAISELNVTSSRRRLSAVGSVPNGSAPELVEFAPLSVVGRRVLLTPQELRMVYRGLAERKVRAPPLPHNISEHLRRRLQSSVTINYEVIVTEPELAAAVATKASNSDNFTAALVENVNSAGAELVASGLITQETLDSIPVINVSEVVVEEPVIETVIEYTIAIETADPELGEEVRFV